MSIVNDENLDDLITNSNVLRILKKNVEYTDEFKIEALKKYTEGYSADEIWKQAGFNTRNFKKGYCRKTLNRWKSQQKNNEIITKKRGRPQGSSKRKFQTQADEIRYLRAENKFLKELRALAMTGKIPEPNADLDLFPGLSKD